MGVLLVYFSLDTEMVMCLLDIVRMVVEGATRMQPTGNISVFVPSMKFYILTLKYGKGNVCPIQ